MAVLERPRPEKRRPGGTLSSRPAHIEDLVRHLNLDPEYIPAARQFGKNLWAERNRFDIDRRARGLFTAQRQIDKSEADRRLHAMLAELSAGGGQ